MLVTAGVRWQLHLRIGLACLLIAGSCSSTNSAEPLEQPTPALDPEVVLRACLHDQGYDHDPLDLPDPAPPGFQEAYEQCADEIGGNAPDDAYRALPRDELETAGDLYVDTALRCLRDRGVDVALKRDQYGIVWEWGQDLDAIGDVVEACFGEADRAQQAFLDERATP